jgi:hypothetical protein
LGVEQAVGAVLITRLLPVLAAPATMWLVATRRPLAEQGFYVILQNIQALAQLAELGLGALVVQFAAHASPTSGWTEDGALRGEAQTLDSIAELLLASLRWYGRAGLLLLLVLPVGLLLFRAEARDSGVALAGPWAGVVAATAAYLVLIPLICLAEGAGRLLNVQRMRSFQALASVSVLWLGIVARDALWGMVLFSVAWIAVPLAWLMLAHSALLRQVVGWVRHAQSNGQPTGTLAERYVRVQRRTAATSLALWVAPQSLAPALLIFQSAADAGRAGFSLALATAPATLGTAWLFARYPRLGAHVAIGDLAARDTLARQAMTQSLSVCALLGALLTGAVGVISMVAPSLAVRILPAGITGALAAAALGWVAIQGWGAWLRAERHEPLTAAIVSGAIVVVGVTVVFAALSDVRTTALAYALAVLTAAAPLAALSFARARRDARPAA